MKYILVLFIAATAYLAFYNARWLGLITNLLVWIVVLKLTVWKEERKK